MKKDMYRSEHTHGTTNHTKTQVINLKHRFCGIITNNNHH